MKVTGFWIKKYIADDFKHIFFKKQQFPQSLEIIQKYSSE